MHGVHNMLVSSPYAGLIVLLVTEICFYGGNSVGAELISPLYQSNRGNKTMNYFPYKFDNY